MRGQHRIRTYPNPVMPQRGGWWPEPCGYLAAGALLLALGIVAGFGFWAF